MFIKRKGGKRLSARVSSSSTGLNDITAHNHYSGSPSGLNLNSRMLEVEEEAPPSKRARTDPHEGTTEVREEFNGMCHDEIVRLSIFCTT